VYLFDDIHLSVGDLAQIKKAGTKMMTDSLADADVAAVVSISGTNSGLTRDRGKLQEAIMKLKTNGLYQEGAQECPNVDYYHGDLIENKHDSSALEAATEEALACAHLDARTMRDEAQRMARSAASRAVTIGEQDMRVTLDVVKEFVHRMGALHGQRTLILVSPGFLTMTAEATSEKSRILDLAAQSDVIISALDARGLYSTELDASSRGARSAPDLMTGSTSEGHREAMSLNENVMAELAEGTGGTFFHNSNDLEGGFRRLTETPEYLYVLEFSLEQVKRDGQYHRLKVKVDQDELRLQARSGYFAAKPAKNER
jgi:VWFA-related protein